MTNSFKVIIAGSRNITDYSIVLDAAHKSNTIKKATQIVSGTAQGVDTLGEQVAKRHNIPIKRFPADWDKYGKSAGYRRNEEMADYADALLVIWDGESKGTKHMIDLAKAKGLKIYIYKV